MISDTLREWLDVSGVELSEQVDPEQFEGLLIDISTSGKLEPSEILACLMSLTVKNYQQDVVRAYQKIISERQVLNDNESGVWKQWVIISALFYIEIDKQYDFPSLGAELISGACRFGKILQNQNIVNVNLCTKDAIQKLNAVDIQAFFNLLFQYAETCQIAGANKSSAILCSIIESIHIFQPNSILPNQLVATYTFWSTSNHKAMKYSQASEIFSLIANDLYEQIGDPMVACQYYVNAALYTKDCNDFDKTIMFVEAAEQIINNKNTKQTVHLLKMKADCNFCRAMKFAVTENFFEAAEFATKAYLEYQKYLASPSTGLTNLSEFLKNILLLTMILHRPESKKIPSSIAVEIRELIDNALIKSRPDYLFLIGKIKVSFASFSEHRGWMTIQEKALTYQDIVNIFKLLKDKVEFDHYKLEFFVAHMGLADTLIENGQFIEAYEKSKFIKQSLEESLGESELFLPTFVFATYGLAKCLYHLKDPRKASMNIIQARNYNRSILAAGPFEAMTWFNGFSYLS